MMDELSPDDKRLWNEVIKGIAFLIGAITLLLLLGVVILVTAVKGLPLWCFVAVLVFIALGKKFYEIARSSSL